MTSLADDVSGAVILLIVVVNDDPNKGKGYQGAAKHENEVRNVRRRVGRGHVRRRWRGWPRLLVYAVPDRALQSNETGEVHALVSKGAMKLVALLRWLLSASESYRRILRRRGCLVAVVLPKVAISVGGALCGILTLESSAIR